jgi:predicted enzyme related to lactoylglutathione lyase
MSTTVPAVRPTVACWFEIPADNFERSIAFYEHVFAVTLRRVNVGQDLAIFPYQQPGVSGSIKHTPNASGAGGPLVYLNADGQLDAMLARVVEAGGDIAAPKAPAPPAGWSAIIIDPEGNRIGLHALN